MIFIFSWMQIEIRLEAGRLWLNSFLMKWIPKFGDTAVVTRPVIGWLRRMPLSKLWMRGVHPPPPKPEKYPGSDIWLLCRIILFLLSSFYCHFCWLYFVTKKVNRKIGIQIVNVWCEFNSFCERWKGGCPCPEFRLSNGLQFTSLLILLLKTEGLRVRVRKALCELRNLRMDFLNIKILWGTKMYQKFTIFKP